MALGSGALEPVSGFAEVDFRAVSVHVTTAKVELSNGEALIRREREVPDRFFKFLLRMKESPYIGLRERCLLYTSPSPRDRG